MAHFLRESKKKLRNVFFFNISTKESAYFFPLFICLIDNYKTKKDCHFNKSLAVEIIFLIVNFKEYITF